MKKIFVLLMLALFMAGCSDEATDFGGEIVVEIPTEATEETNVSDNGAVTDGAFSAGISSGNTYKSEFIGIQCTLEDGWILLSNEDVRAENETILGVSAENYKEATSLYDMMGNHINGYDSMAILVEKVTGTDALLTEEEYLAASKDTTVAGFRNMGFQVEAAEVVTVQFAGKEHAALNIRCTYSGNVMYESLVAIKCGNYFAYVTVCTWDENACADILAWFTAY